MKREERDKETKGLIDLIKKLRFSIFNCNVSISFSMFSFIMASTGMTYIFKCIERSSCETTRLLFSEI